MRESQDCCEAPTNKAGAEVIRSNASFSKELRASFGDGVFYAQ